MRSIECGVEGGGGGLVELGEGRSRKGRAQRSPIFLALGKPRLGRALVESCTGSAWTFNIFERGVASCNLSLFGLIAAVNLVARKSKGDTATYTRA